MKKLTLISALAAIATILSIPSAAQNRSYIKTCGKRTTNITWSGGKSGDGYKYTITTGSQKEYFTLNSKKQTTEWRLVDESKGTDYTVSLSGGIYTFTGKNKSKEVKKTEKSTGLPWYQNIEINGSGVLAGKSNVKFECVRPGNLDVHTMQANDKGVMEVEGFQARLLQATLIGPFAGMWSCDYYYDAKSGEFVVYKAVEGGPGTPETKIVRK